MYLRVKFLYLEFFNSQKPQQSNPQDHCILINSLTEPISDGHLICHAIDAKRFISIENFPTPNDSLTLINKGTTFLWHHQKDDNKFFIG